MASPACLGLMCHKLFCGSSTPFRVYLEAIPVESTRVAPIAKPKGFVLADQAPGGIHYGENEVCREAEKFEKREPKLSLTECLNPQKLAGQCSKLKCCMMYEYDAYVDARKEFPRLREPLQTIDGDAVRR